MDNYYFFLLLLPIVAFMYASVGHGGASGYLSMMTLFSFPPEVMKPTALLLNLFIAGIAFFHFYRAGFFNRKLFMAFAIGSIPLSFLGGMITVDTKIYKVILGILLIFAILRLLHVFGKESETIRKIKIHEGIIVGASIGFFSGLIGIGGGIILTPVILLMRWGKIKEAAAVSALFIWVNSASGLVGQFTIGIQLDSSAWLFVALALVGGYFGGYFGAKKINNQLLRYLLAVVLVLASAKLLLT